MRMFSERYSSPSTSDAQSQQHGYICMSTTVNELSYTPSHEEKTCAVAASSEFGQNPMNSGSGFFTNSQNVIITGGTFILNKHGASGRETSLKSKGEAERCAISSTSDKHGFIGMSTIVDELSYTPSQGEARDAEQVVATGRKSWKTLRGKGETVWPPLLQAALIEALEMYHHEAIRPRAQKSGRFLMRNQFISNYIYETTGKSRTPMQVSSRLQRLRDICKGDKKSQASFSSRASVTRHLDEAPSRIPTFINVQISLQKVLKPCPVPTVPFVDNDPMNPHIILLSPLSHADLEIRASASSSLSYLSRTVKFFSPCTLELQSTFLVYSDNCSTPVHSEIAPLKCLSSPTQQSSWLYSSDIAPDFWDTLCFSPDLSRYTILQSVKPIPDVHFESNAFTDSSRASPTLFITYKFSYQKLGLQTSFNTVAASVYPTSFPTSSSHNHWQVSRPSKPEPLHSPLRRVPHLNYYSPNSRSTSGSWFDDRDLGEVHWPGSIDNRFLPSTMPLS